MYYYFFDFHIGTYLLAYVAHQKEFYCLDPQELGKH